jgi:hypothetical protein
MGAAFVSLQHGAVRLKSIIGGVPARVPASLLVPVRSQLTPLTADPATAARAQPHARLTPVQR